MIGPKEKPIPQHVLEACEVEPGDVPPGTVLEVEKGSLLEQRPVDENVVMAHEDVMSLAT